MATVNINWNPPSGTPVEQITGYILFTKITGSSLPTQQTIPAGTTSAVVSLAPGKGAEFQVAAVGNEQTGVKSDPVSVDPLPAPGAPENVTAVISL